MAKTLSLELPEDLIKHWRSERALKQRTKEVLVLDLVREHKISFRQGAKLLGMEYWDFLDFMSERGVSVIDYPIGAVKKDIANLRKFKESK